MGVVGAALAILFIFLLWRFCIRRKATNGGNVDQIPPQSRYHPLSTIPGSGIDVPHTDNSISMTSDDYYGFGVDKYGLVIVLLLPLAQIPSLIVRIFMARDLLSPSVMIAAPRRILINRPHTIRINQDHHPFRALNNKSITALKGRFR